MSFKEGLEQITAKLDDARAVAIVDVDGILVEEHRVDATVDIQAVVAEYSALLSVADKASRSIDLGPSQEVTALTDKGAIVIRAITNEYFLLLITLPDCNIGRGRFFLKQYAAAFAEEM